MSCDDNGFISNWRGTTWDLSRWRGEPAVDATLIKMLVSLVELRALRKMVSGPERQAIIDGAVVVAGNIFLQGRQDDFDNLVGYIAAEANHEPNRKLQRILDGIADRVEAVLGDH
jgi:hypothetical protein